MSLRRLTSLEVAGRAIFVRVDFNVPLTPEGEVADDSRIVASLPTLRYLLDKGGRLVIASHLGRPKGKPDRKLSLLPVRAVLSKYLKAPVGFAETIVGPEAEAAARVLKPGEALLLENLRFDPREEANDPEWSRALARLADAYVNDAFGSAHRAHASTVGITAFLPDRAAGFLMEKELSALGRLLEGAERPYVSILGGAKISGKIDVVKNLLPRVDRLLIGGGMMFTFLRAKGIATGRSLVEEEKIPLAAELLASPDGGKIGLPVDCRAAADTGGSDEGRVVPVSAIPPDRMGVDIGPESLAAIGAVLAEAKTVFWNGPMGIFEMPAYAAGTIGTAREVAIATRRGAFTVVGGGDSLAAVRRAEMEHQISHLSTGGGASLEFLEGRELPGVAALEAAARPA
ncbi:MAG TPA: phosphoglycerate kinase [Candidatus Limnocylindrales bacterium]|nr:phosphoglycerate kinase [Candidatus Limnocylindrales bacterium]